MAFSIPFFMWKQADHLLQQEMKETMSLKTQFKAGIDGF